MFLVKHNISDKQTRPTYCDTRDKLPMCLHSHILSPFHSICATQLNVNYFFFFELVDILYVKLFKRSTLDPLVWVMTLDAINSKPCSFMMYGKTLDDGSKRDLGNYTQTRTTELYYKSYLLESSLIHVHSSRASSPIYHS